MRRNSLSIAVVPAICLVLVISALGANAGSLGVTRTGLASLDRDSAPTPGLTDPSPVLDLLNGNNIVSSSLLYNGYFNTNDNSFPRLLTGSATSQFWASPQSVMLMAPALTFGHDTGTLLFSNPFAANVTIQTVAVVSPAISGDGVEAYFFVTPLKTTNWETPYYATDPEGPNGTFMFPQGSVMFPYSDSPYVAVQWEPAYHSSRFNLYMVTPGAGGVVTPGNIKAVQIAGTSGSGFPSADDFLTIKASYNVTSDAFSVQITDENNSAVSFGFGATLSSYGFAPSYSPSESYFFGAGASGNSPAGWGLLYLSTTAPGIALKEIFSDEFTRDSVLNGSLWQLNSPLLSSIATAEGAAWNLGELMGSTVPPLSFSSAGLTWGAEGIGNWTGLTTTSPVTPPVDTELQTTLGPFTGGNPVVVCATDVETAFACVFLSNQLWFTLGAEDPIPEGGHLTAGDAYSIWLNLTTSSVSFSVHGPGVGAVWSSTFSPQDEAYYFSIGSLAGQVPGEVSGSFTVNSDFVQFAAFSSQSWSLSTTVLGSEGQVLPGATVTVTNKLNSTQSATGETGANGIYTANSLLSGEYLVTAYYPTGATPGGALVPPAFSNVVVGSPTSPTSIAVSTSVLLITPPILPVSVTITSSPADLTPTVGESVELIAAASNGTLAYAYAWTVLGDPSCTSSSPVLECSFNSPGAYEVTVSVTCVGQYYGQSCPPGSQGSAGDPATAHTIVQVTTTTYEAPVAVSSDWILGPPLQLSYPYSTPATPDEVFVQLPSSPAGQDLITANMVLPAPWDDSLAIPSGIAGLIAFSPAFYEIQVSYEGGPLYSTGTTLQAGISTISSQHFGLPPGGAPVTAPGLQGTSFLMDLTSRSCLALAQDVVSTFFSVVLGLEADETLKITPGTELFASSVQTILQDLASAFSGLGCKSDSGTPSSSWTSALSSIWNQLPDIIIGLAGSLGETEVVKLLGEDVGKVVTKAALWPGFLTGMITLAAAIFLYPTIPEEVAFGSPFIPVGG